MTKAPIRVAVTGAAGQIGYALLFRIASGEMLGRDQPVILQMLELPMDKAQQALKAVMMELEDCAFPLLAGMIGTGDPRVAFAGAQQALLVGSRPRGPGMERKELLLENARIFTEQGKAIDEVASRDIKVIVVGNPANTNALIAMNTARSLPRSSFTSMMRLDHNRSVSKVARLTGRPVTSVEKMAVWGNHSPTMYPDTRFATVDGERATDLLNAKNWNRDEYIGEIGARGATIIGIRGLSSAASAANAAIDHMRDWNMGSGGQVGHDGGGFRRLIRHPGGDGLRLPLHHRQRQMGDRQGPGDRRVLARQDGFHAERASGRARAHQASACLRKSAASV